MMNTTTKMSLRDRRQVRVSEISAKEKAEEYIRLRKDPEGFTVKKVNEEIGRGLFTKKAFGRGEFLIEYSGELICCREGERRLATYKRNIGSFIYFFRKNGKATLCIDATKSKQKGRYANDAPPMDPSQNATMKMLVVDGEPHLVLFAKRNIEKGVEIRYDYGVPNLPWRQKDANMVRKANLSDMTDGKTDELNVFEQVKECYVSLKRCSAKEIAAGLKLKGVEMLDPLGAETKVDGLEGATEDHANKADGLEGATEDHATIAGGLEGATEAVEMSDPLWEETKADGLESATEGVEMSDPLGEESEADGLEGATEAIGISNPLEEETKTGGLERATEGVEMSDPLGEESKADGLEGATEAIEISNPLEEETKTGGLEGATEGVEMSDPLGEESKVDGLEGATEAIEISNPLEEETKTGGLEGATEGVEMSDPLREESKVDGLESATEAIEISNPLEEETKTGGLEGATEGVGMSDPLREESKVDGLESATEAIEISNPLEEETKTGGLEGATEAIEISNPLEEETKTGGLEGATEAIEMSNPLGEETKGNGLEGATEAVELSEVMGEETKGHGLEGATEAVEMLDPLGDETKLGGLEGATEAVEMSDPLGEETKADGKEGTTEAIGISNPLEEETKTGGLEGASEGVEMSDPLREETKTDGLEGATEAAEMLDAVRVETNADLSEGETEGIQLTTDETVMDEYITTSEGQKYHVILSKGDSGTDENVVYITELVGEINDSVEGNTEERNSTRGEINDSVQGNTEERNSTGVTHKTKPHRPCPYCGEFKSALSGHLKAKHADEDEVKEALKLPKMDRVRAFASIRKKGIFLKNVEIIKESDTTAKDDLIRERMQSSKDIVYCSICLAYITKSHFPQHRRICEAAEKTTTSPASMPVPSGKESTNFKKNILDKFHCNEVGLLIRSDELIKSYGQREFDKMEKKINKKDEKRRTIMSDMRRLANLFLEFRNIYTQEGGVGNVEALQVKDMFDRTNFKILESALHSSTTDLESGKLKAGLKVGLGNLIKKVVKYMKGEYLIEKKDLEANEMDRFQQTLIHHWNSIFSDAENTIELSRQNELRKPKKLPIEDDVKKLRKYTVDTIEELSGDRTFMGESEFSRLRDALVCRLTLFNARRGGEPSRLLLSEWADAKRNEWVKESDVEKVEDPLEKLCAIDHKLAYQAGKRGGQLVPLLIPKHCMKGMSKLADSKVREDAGVLKNNIYMFPSTRNSEQHAIGWHCVARCSKAARLESHFNATENRHLIATYYAALDVNERERGLFYEHMGHSENINKHIYQCPPGVQEATKVAKHLHSYDTDLAEECDRRQDKEEQQFKLKEFLKKLAGRDAAERALNNQGIIEESEVETKPELLLENAEYMCDMFLQDSARPYFTKDGWLVASTTLDTLQGLVEKAQEEEKNEITENMDEDEDNTQICDSDNAPSVSMKRKATELDSSTMESTGTEQDERKKIKKTNFTNTTRAGNRRWKKEHTDRVKQHFKDYIYNTENFDNKGSLPSTTMMKKFLEENKDILADLDATSRLLKLRTKIFNERKTMRLKTQTSLKSLKFN